MPEELKDLIDKINEEGVRAAEEKAREIALSAKAAADEALARANKEAKKIIADAEERAIKMKENQKTLLKQAARDLLISLRKEINTMLERIIVSNVQKILTPEELAKMLTELVKGRGEGGDIVISLNKEDIGKLEKAFFGELKDRAKKGITIKPSEDIQAGFVISYDSGRSYYDFTDKALADYISTYLKPKLADILKE